MALADRTVSAHHAVIRMIDEDRFQLMDLGTTNGTYVGGERVAKVELSDGDFIMLGETRLRFDGSAPGPRAANVPANTLRRIEPKSVTVVQGERASQSFRAQTRVEPALFHDPDKLADEQLRRDYEKLRVAFQLSRAVVGEDEIETLLERIVDTAVELLRADRAVVLLTNHDTGDLEPRVAKQRHGTDGGMSLSSSILEHVTASGEGVLCEDLGTDARFNRSQSIVSQGIRSAMCVPMLDEGQLVGVIHMDSLVGTRMFEQTDLEVFSLIAQQAASMVKTTMLKEQLRTAQRRRAESMRALIGGASHFINNPLAVICSNLSILGEWAERLEVFHSAVKGGASFADEYASQGVDFIDSDLLPMTNQTRTAAARISEIVTALRVFDGSADEDERSVVDLLQVLEAAIVGEEDSINQVAQVHRQLASVSIYGVPRQLVALFRALISNAWQAISPGNREANWVIVSVDVSERRVMVCVDDTGRGVPPENRERIFAPFFTDRLDGPLGLGLATATEIANQHDAVIRVLARPGGGSRFAVEFPAPVTTH